MLSRIITRNSCIFSIKNHKLKQQQIKLIITPFVVRKFTSSNTKQENALEKIKQEIEESKKRLQWRKPLSENSQEWQSKFKVFGDDEQNSDFISLMQQPIDLSPSSVKKWWENRKEYIERQMQSYIPERHNILGNDLAVGHFLVYRGGSVKYLNQKSWIKSKLSNNENYNEDNDLPKKYDPEWKLEAIRCDNMKLYYEGLENIRNLQNLKFWSLVNCKTIDDWCLDRISGGQNPKLEVLDLTGTNITYRGLNALYRLESLKVLVLDDPKVSKELELTCALLEDALPKLKIYAAKDIH